jgi:hypothetical protein
MYQTRKENEERFRDLETKRINFMKSVGDFKRA